MWIQKLPPREACADFTAARMWSEQMWVCANSPVEVRILAAFACIAKYFMQKKPG